MTMQTEVDFIMAYEGGTLTTERQLVEGFAGLIRSGAAWTLQGHYGRAAIHLINKGVVSKSGDILVTFDDDGSIER